MGISASSTVTRVLSAVGVVVTGRRPNQVADIFHASRALPSNVNSSTRLPFISSASTSASELYVSMVYDFGVGTVLLVGYEYARVYVPLPEGVAVITPASRMWQTCSNVSSVAGSASRP